MNTQVTILIAFQAFLNILIAPCALLACIATVSGHLSGSGRLATRGAENFITVLLDPNPPHTFMEFLAVSPFR